MFPNIEEEKTFFTKQSPGKDSDKLKIEEIEGLEDNDANNPPDFACYMYYYDKLNYKTRFEIAIRGKADGWVWMGIMDQIPSNTQYYKSWYREFLLEKNEKIWEVNVGQEGEIVPPLGRGGYTMTLAIQNFHNAFNDVKWIVIPKKEYCANQKQMCIENLLLKAGYWTPDKESENFLVNITRNVGNQITRWSSKANHKLIHQSRKRIYKDYEWYENVDHLKDTPLIKLDDKKAALVKGNWKDLLALCEKKDAKSYDQPYKVLCRY